MSIDRISPDFFIGTEVESSPAKGLNTLFVVGIQSGDKIKEIIGSRNAYLDYSKHIRHVYLGANMSLHDVANDDGYTWNQIDDMVDEVLENIAIDYALMEKTQDLLVMPASFDWMDLGSFKDLHKAVESNEAGNHTHGPYIELEGVTNSFVQNHEEDRKSTRLNSSHT